MGLFSKRIRWRAASTPTLFIAIGLILILFPKASIRLFCIICGALIALFALKKIIFFSNKIKKNFLCKLSIFGSILLFLVGGWITFVPQIFITIANVIIGTTILIYGSRDIKNIYKMCKNRYINWYKTIALEVLIIAIGILIILKPFKSLDVLALIMGIAFIMDGASDLCIIFDIHNKQKILGNK